ncbi:carbohydrate ABC transporter permease [Thermanaerothrix sp. 4228-RoL]|jgi:putative aldouronate transport system permease protein|uniref:Carbohydrate ABC transporter permease n=1 Tax=Thermanaerothrix solaris TaxID=3058434 RepID=A0ABU3NMX1_9CHLR|nr:carbohydrate ABC transporter permease [Thermanaerothrix sp. 4228-RoL]MDT8898200.1 carbohydrate ABC transporter permease [Thermanaerothrix sp. 4228-RoL]
MERLLSKDEKRFKKASILFVGLFAVIVFSPFVLIAICSISSTESLISKGYSFFPKSLSLDAYLYMWAQGKVILRAYGVSLFVTIVGTATSLVITPMLAYPLSRKDFRLRGLFTFLVFFTLLFNGGVVPSYIMWTRVFSLKNTIWALILPTYLMNGFNVLLVKNYFERSIPRDLIEAAQIDGANEWTIFSKIMVPLSVPVLATIGLFTGLAYWNDWINGLYYISDPSLYGIQQLLIRILNNIAFLRSGAAASVVGNMVISLPGESIRMALAVIGILPILIVFPLLQKYFIKGIVIGAIKG